MNRETQFNQNCADKKIHTHQNTKKQREIAKFYEILNTQLGNTPNSTLPH